MYKKKNIVAAVILAGLLVSTTSRATINFKNIDFKDVFLTSIDLYTAYALIIALWPQNPVQKVTAPTSDDTTVTDTDKWRRLEGRIGRRIIHQQAKAFIKTVPVKQSTLGNVRDGISNFMNRMFPTK